jgi:hypothetical protein
MTARPSWSGGQAINNGPPAGQDDDAAIAAVEGVYQAGFDALAERFGRVE